MLVLSRKKSQSIRIGNDIEIKVIEVSGDRVRIGISAPSDVSIMREELVARPQSDTTTKSEDCDLSISEAVLTMSPAGKPVSRDTLRSASRRVLARQSGRRR